MRPRIETFEFKQLDTADLIVDALYEGGDQRHAGDDALNRLMNCGNQGGFRFVGSTDAPLLCVLYSALTDPDWPDALDFELGRFTYYGDNKKFGHELHDTPRKGNLILRNAFQHLHAGERAKIPPFFVFTKGGRGRSVTFRGLAVPGVEGIDQTQDLVAIWKTANGQRFQNYRATFTILDIGQIPRAWLDDVRRGAPFSPKSPPVWKEWIDTGFYRPLLAPKTVKYRTKAEQLPSNALQKSVIEAIVSHFKNHPRREYAFEACAAEIASKMDSNVVQCELTRPWRDGGRDAVGEYRIGTPGSSIRVEFALEAKCKGLDSGCGVASVARLISRLRHRQFGIFVTTSYVSQQAYEEIVEDRHPVIVLSARDIAEILAQGGYNSAQSVVTWLNTNFPY